MRPIVCLLLLSLPTSALAETPPRKIDFNRDVKPVLSNTCFKCHGPDAAERKGGSDGLRLDTADGITADLGGYAAIVPGQPEKSALVARITSNDPDEFMPPPTSGKKLTQHEIEALTQWIREGAKYQGHWSYIKPARPALPPVKDSAWPRNAVDYFILARLDREGLAPSPEADRYALIRRLSLDLTGLPPGVEEVDAFVGDADPQAYERLVDRLLERPAYGEHWGHLWLDLARYADSAGYADDPPRTIWLFRDYVIRALNDNKPFDQFTIEQVAGDLLPNPTEEQLVATAFHRNTLTNNEGGTNDEEFRNVAVVDRVNTTMAVWMGTTIACAQCHNHKYDPISQEEYFRFFAFFNNTEDADRGDESPLFSIYSDEQQRRRAQWQQELAGLNQTLRTMTPGLAAGQTGWEQAFPLDTKRQVLTPTAVKSQAGVETRITEGGEIHVAAGAANDVYTIEAAPDAGTIRAIQLDVLPDDGLPSKGPGHADGNFVLSRIAVRLDRPADQPLSGRYLRIELPGKEKILSLAEVQAFHGDENLALPGEASQSSTASDGPAKLAIDGNTDGRYNEAKSTTHTEVSENPWWEVDLKGEHPLDRVVVWNRTDSGVEGRLAGFCLLVLNDRREPVWSNEDNGAPNPKAELSFAGPQSVELAAAVADYSQPNFDAADALKNDSLKQKGWAVGGQTGQPHSLTLVARSPIELKPGAKLTVTIEHAFQSANHTLGHFRLSATDDARAAELARTPRAVVDALRVSADQRTAEQRDRIVQHYLSIAPDLQPVRDRVAALNKQVAEMKPMTVPVLRDVPAGQRRKTQIQHRGNFLDVGKEVSEGTPATFPPPPTDALLNRLTLARWLVDENNPLTSRVIANRCWEQLFGIGIVASSEEFGSQGDLPYHPELLDDLATELVRLKWDMKAFVKLLVTSAAYRQSSRVTPELETLDPDNRLLARGPRFRLSAEMVRDQALAVAGLLSSKMYGPPVKPPQPSIGLSAAFGSGIDWQTSGGEDRYRRGLYTTWRRSNPYPSMATFDAPNREVCIVRRVRTNTPLQALVTLNDPVYVEASQALARRMTQEGGSTAADRARYGFRLCVARPPRDDELARLVQLYEKELARFRQSPAEAQKLATDPLGPPPAGADLAELASWTLVSNVLLNMDETLMKR
ncbi:MAG TPA: DUF1553 domain-containing protein [Pirellulales bacterium]|jgi:hypothetical protein|nr:DUF1553 domain-containing protein [Pirellulales bacterium]